MSGLDRCHILFHRKNPISLRLLAVSAGMIAGIGLLIGSSAISAPPPTAANTSTNASAKQQSKQALSRFNSLIGGWRGVGMIRPNSRKGAWLEKAEWIWDFNQKAVAIRYKVAGGKLLTSAVLTWDPARKRYKAYVTFRDKSQRDYTGTLKETELILDSKPEKDGYVHRLTVARLNFKRTIVRYQKRRTTQSFYTRVAEVGYTRQGTRLAVAGSSGPVCVVTGGQGKIRVTYKGKTYYVCCTGCKQAFEDDPVGVLAEYRKRLAEKKKKSSALK